VVCPACSIAWGWKSPIQPDGGEGLAEHKGHPRWRLKAVPKQNREPDEQKIGYQASLSDERATKSRSPESIKGPWL